jgi:hypothetical protein
VLTMANRNKDRRNTTCKNVLVHAVTPEALQLLAF